MDWGAGTSREFDDPQAGQATFLLKNTNRRFEPEYAAGAYYPNIVPGRRFRITLTADGVSTTQGIWYAQSWQVEYPAGTTYSTVTVTCTDGFWRLALKPLGGLAGNAESYRDVISACNPVAYFPLDEASGTRFSGDPGPDGSFRGGQAFLGMPNTVVGDAGTAVQLPAGVYGRAKADDVDVFRDAGQLTLEAVATINSGGTSADILSFGYNAGVLALNLELRADRFLFNAGTSVILNPSAPSNGDTFHVAVTWDGGVMTYYVNGAAKATLGYAGALSASDTGEYFYIKSGHGSESNEDITISHAAFYDYALSASTVAGHATAALSRGYAAQTSGTRIAAIATDSLWSTAGITAGTITAAPRFQTGQTAIDEITETAKIEQPGSFFYFDDAGNPDYQALLDTQTVSATFGDTPAEVQYDDISLVYNDELFNSSNVSGEGLDGATRQNTTSISDYGTRSQDATGLIITSNADAALLAQTIVDRFSTPAFRVDSITLNGADQDSRTQIITRQIGDTIRVKRRGEGGTAIDIITRILAKRKTLDTNGDLRCQWTLARGFSAATSADHLGVTGYSELGQNFILA
jgi:hypothetical protein